MDSSSSISTILATLMEILLGPIVGAVYAAIKNEYLKEKRDSSSARKLMGQQIDKVYKPLIGFYYRLDKNDKQKISLMRLRVVQQCKLVPPNLFNAIMISEDIETIKDILDANYNYAKMKCGFPYDCEKIDWDCLPHVLNQRYWEEARKKVARKSTVLGAFALVVYLIVGNLRQLEGKEIIETVLTYWVSISMGIWAANSSPLGSRKKKNDKYNGRHYRR